jgi:membrane protein insertase Oxa1/YidC/SpoIIIJ
MLLHDYHNKKYIEIKDDKITFYRFLYKSTLNLDKVRAAYIDDDYFLRILYGKRIKIYKIANIKNSEKPLLYVLIEELNKEKILFSTNAYYVLSKWFWVIITSINIGNIIKSNIFFEPFFWLIILIVISITLFLVPYSSSNFIYDYKNNLIKLEVAYGRTKEYAIGIDKINLIYKPVDKIYRLKVNKIESLLIKSNVIYPIDYKEKLHELYKITQG